MIHAFRVGLRGRRGEHWAGSTRVPGQVFRTPILASLRPTVADCATCVDYYQSMGDGHGRCAHPHRGCPSCATRIDPWTHAKACPLKGHAPTVQS